MTARPPIADLLAYIDACPSPYHACATTASRLEQAGFERLDERRAWEPGQRRGFVVRDGTLVAWDASGADEHAPFRVIGAHTDSPNLRIKPRPDSGRAGFAQLGVEVYGGALLNSWLDRDLGLSGRAAVRGAGGADERLFRADVPLLRIPQLAIHLDREVNERGLVLNRQNHLMPLWSLGEPDEGGFAAYVAELLGVDPDDVLAWDAMLHDVVPAAVLGRDEAFVSASRIDNLVSCWAATTALVDASPSGTIGLLCLYDHEEVGSVSTTGADGAVLRTLIERVHTLTGGGRDTLHRSLAGSMAVSADGAHATHPNYPERHDPEHHIRIGGGPALKVNASERYATSALSGAELRLTAERAEVPIQSFVSRSDLPCGSTIGPMTAARLGIPVVDVGVPQLAMHSCRELCGRDDPVALSTLLGAFLSPAT